VPIAAEAFTSKLYPSAFATPAFTLVAKDDHRCYKGDWNCNEFLRQQQSQL
jgi:hypothetical protein